MRNCREPPDTDEDDEAMIPDFMSVGDAGSENPRRHDFVQLLFCGPVKITLV